MAILPENLGSVAFKEDYNVRYAYVSGSMVKGISSPELVIRMGKAGYLSFYGSGGMKKNEVENALKKINLELSKGESYGVNLLFNPMNKQNEVELVDLFLRYNVRCIEASAFIQITPALLKFRLQGCTIDSFGKVNLRNRIIAKISRPEIAKLFLSPPPYEMVQQLLTNGFISSEEAAVAQKIPVASDICVESDSAGHTDMGIMSTLLPTIIRLRDVLQEKFNFFPLVRIGAGGGLGTPESIACAFLLGADFVLTGSINQCTVEAGTSNVVKDILQEMQVHDSAYAPAGDMFEVGAKIQVLKRGILFHIRANRLYDLWRNYDSIEKIDITICKEIQDRYFRRTFNEVYNETQEFYSKISPIILEKAEKDPKIKMALIFRWYFSYTMRLALKGKNERVNYQVHTSSALGSYNQWVNKTSMQNWQKRHVDSLAYDLLNAAADYVSKRIKLFNNF